MSPTVTIALRPSGMRIEVERGTPLHDTLFAYGVEFPCGGRGRCKGCRVRLLEGSLPVTPPQEEMLSEEELRAGWRLSCQCSAESDLALELAQWEAQILTDNTRFPFTPREGLGAAVDIGTTTLVAQLLDMRTGDTLAVRTSLNAQAKHGADVMSRVSFAVAEGGHQRLVSLIRKQIATMVRDLLAAAGRPAEELTDIVLVGNSVMHHVFCGFDLTALSHYPFESPTLSGMTFSPDQLGWEFSRRARVRFLPCIGGYVGSDIVAGILASRLHSSRVPTLLIDLGTNGEIVLASGSAMVCCSTAAGPAFEGARIHMGMRAATGAIAEVHRVDGGVSCHTLGNVPPRGICGSGLVDAVAAFLDLGFIQPNGRVRQGEPYLELCPPVRLSQTDIRELQLAKGAIAAGVRVLLEVLGLKDTDIEALHLAGAFGNYVNTSSAERIGLIKFPPAIVHPAGNTALLGAKMALFTPDADIEHIASSVTHVSLHAHPQFQEIYVDEMRFPERA